MLLFLGKQRKQYVIMVTEQAGNQSFNRAKLFNVAVKETASSSTMSTRYQHRPTLSTSVAKMLGNWQPHFDLRVEQSGCTTAFGSRNGPVMGTS
ncbi:Beta-1,4-galactosyltransferase 3 [Sparganum proliferum]